MIYYLRRLSQFHRDHPRSFTFMATVLLAVLSLVIGLAVTIFDGLLHPVGRIKLFFIFTGMVGFYIPGTLMGVAAIGLRKGWTRMVALGALGAAAQGVMALIVTFGQFTVTDFEWLPLIKGLLWTLADFYVAVRLWRAIPWVAADAEARGGFEVGQVTEAEVA